MLTETKFRNGHLKWPRATKIMKAISLVPGTPGLKLKDVEEPMITQRDEVKIKVWQVGICGTDREQAEGGRAKAPSGKSHLIIGHEMFGQVMEIGEEVRLSGACNTA